MKINTVGVLGAGAVGGYFIWGLSEKLGNNLYVIASGERAERYKKNGITINDTKYALNVKTPEEAKGVDLLLVATKYGALPEVLNDIEEIVSKHTIVLSLLNGVDSEEMIAKRIGMERIIPSFMVIASEHRADGIHFDGELAKGVFYGESNQTEPSERMLAIQELLEGTKLHYHMCEDIWEKIWNKYALNVSYNQPQAILQVGVGAYVDSEHVAFLSMKLRDEVVAVANAKGIHIPSSESPYGSAGRGNPKSRYSMLQDIDAGKHTEVDMFAGAMVRMGKELGISTPYNEFVYHAVKALEEKNDNKFDY